MTDVPIVGVGYGAYKATQKVVEGGARALGADEQTAREIGTGAGIGVGAAASIATGNPLDAAAIAADVCIEAERFQGNKTA